jgi:hypothetical protein
MLTSEALFDDIKRFNHISAFVAKGFPAIKNSFEGIM